MKITILSIANINSIKHCNLYNITYLIKKSYLNIKSKPYKKKSIQVVVFKIKLKFKLVKRLYYIIVNRIIMIVFDYKLIFIKSIISIMKTHLNKTFKINIINIIYT